MNARWSAAKVRVNHRLAMHVPVERYRLNNATPMVSFTFDDIPKSAATTGAGILEDHGARGTFYVSGGLVGTMESPDWAAVDASLDARRVVPAFESSDRDEGEDAGASSREGGKGGRNVDDRTSW